MPSGVVVDNKQTKIFRSNSRLNVDKETLTKIQNKKNVEKQIESKEKDLEKGILIHIIILIFNLLHYNYLFSKKRNHKSG